MKYSWLTCEAALVAVSFLCCFASTDRTNQPLEYLAHAASLPTRHPPSYLHPCHRRQKKFNLCVKTTLQNLFTAVTHGSKELELPPIDPLLVPHLKIAEGSGDVSLSLKFENVTILGLGNTRVLSVRSNLEDNKLEITMKYPYLIFIGDYKGEGSVRTFPIVGEGDFSFNMTDVSAAWIIYLRQSTDFIENHLAIDQFLIDVIPVEISAKFGSAIDDDNRLGSAMNEFFNENAQEIFKITKPKIADALSGVFSNLANMVLGRYSSQVLLPP